MTNAVSKKDLGSSADTFIFLTFRIALRRQASLSLSLSSPHTSTTMSDDNEAEVAARAARLQAMQDSVTDAGNNVRALKVRDRRPRKRKKEKKNRIQRERVLINQRVVEKIVSGKKKRRGPSASCVCPQCIPISPPPSGPQNSRDVLTMRKRRAHTHTHTSFSLPHTPSLKHETKQNETKKTGCKG